MQKFRFQLAMVYRAAAISILVSLTLARIGGRWLWHSWRGVALERRIAAAGELCADLCRRLGATFVKLGQVLATRSDLLPNAFRERLAALHEQVGSFPYALVRQTVVDELGAPPESIFAQFDPYPVASASVAQVHRAVLANGRDVAVKVLRPRVEESVDRDLRVMRVWARILAWLPPIATFAPVRVLGEFAHALRAQLDLRREAVNNRRFRDNFADADAIHIPSLVEELCTQRVLCMEFVDGQRLPLGEHAPPPADEEDEGPEGGMDREALARAGYQMVLSMVFEHGFVHADLHPGNLRVHEGRVVFFDLGLVAEVSPEQRRALVALCLAWATRDVDAICQHMAGVAFHGESPRDPERLHAAVEALLERYGDIVLADIQVGHLLLDLLRLVRRQWADFDPSFTMVALSIAVVEGVARQLAPEMRLMQEALPLLQRIAATAASET